MDLFNVRWAYAISNNSNMYFVISVCEILHFVHVKQTPMTRRRFRFYTVFEQFLRTNFHNAAVTQAEKHDARVTPNTDPPRFSASCCNVKTVRCIRHCSAQMHNHSR